MAAQNSPVKRTASGSPKGDGSPLETPVAGAESLLYTEYVAPVSDHPADNLHVKTSGVAQAGPSSVDPAAYHTDTVLESDVDQSGVKRDVVMMRKFFTTTSCHGVSRAWSWERTWYQRKFWGATTLLSLTILIKCLVEIYDQYYKYPVQQTVMFREEASLPFPAVTICSLTELDMRRADTQLQVKNASEKLFNLFATDSVTREHMLDTLLTDPAYDDILSLTKRQVFDGASPQLEDFLIYCSYDNKPFPCKDNFHRTTQHTHCFQFNNDMKGVRVAEFLGPRSGLRLILRVDEEAYVIGHGLEAGAKIILHKVDTYPDVIIHGYMLRPGTSTFMSLHYTEEMSLPRPYMPYGAGYCKEDAHFGYTRLGCIHQCVARNTSKSCGCSAFNTDTGDGANGKATTYPDCTMREYFQCFRPRFQDAVFSSQSSGRDGPCQMKCPRRCDQAKYEVTHTQAKFPSDVAAAYLARNNFLDPDHRYLEARIFFEDMMKTKISYHPRYTKDVIIGIIGGHLGFFVGASFITIFELFEFLFYASEWFYHKSCRRPSDQETLEPEVLTQEQS